MKRFLIGGAIVASVIILVVLVWPNAREITNHPPKNDTVVAFGDSLVYGFGDNEEGGFVSDLEQLVGVSIENEGFPGDTSSEGLARIGNVHDHNPGIVILLLGGNDYLRRIERQETRQNLARIITELQDEGAVVILLGVRGGVLRDNFEKMYEGLADEYGTYYVSDVLDGLITDPELMYDRIHPNSAGYQSIAERIAPILRSALEGTDR